jgi:predicted RNase H-like nuclease
MLGEIVAVIGLDACKTGWVAVVVDGTGFRDAFVVPGIREAERRGVTDYGATHIVVDIPIGIPDSSSRAADTQARRFIAPRGSSVFPTPVRAALEAETYAEARIASLAACGKSLSAQAYAIRERILDVDAHLESARIPVLEGHPEVSFREMAGQGIVHPKKTFAGMSLRHQLLADEGILVPFGLESTLRGAAADDVLDAAAMAWTARRVAQGVADRFPPGTDAERFSDGVDSAIWF